MAVAGAIHMPFLVVGYGVFVFRPMYSNSLSPLGTYFDDLGLYNRIECTRIGRKELMTGT